MKRAILLIFVAGIAACKQSRKPSPLDTPDLYVLHRPQTDTMACVFSGQVDQMPETDPASTARPAYPNELRKIDLEGSVLAKFVVDTAGYAEPLSFRAVRSTHRYFTEAVRKTLPRIHYLPAMKEGKPVRCWMDQEFFFTLDR